MNDITFFENSARKRYKMEQALFASFAGDTCDAVIGQRLDGTITSWNTGAERIFGFVAEEAVGRPISFLLGDKHSEEPPATVERCAGDKRTPPCEVMCTRKDGRRIDVELTVSPVVDSAGNWIAISTIARDTAEPMSKETKRDLMLRELSHRIKNMLATVQSVMTQTLNNAPDMETFRAVFDARIQALSNTHDLLTRRDWRKAWLRELIQVELRPYGDKQQPPWRITGEAVQIEPAKAITLGMAVHELATNAAKYGALSTAAGRVEVSWEIACSAGRPTLEFLWVEHGGPPADKPRRRGFGLKLIEEGLAFELGAQVRLDFKREGLCCAVEIPLARIAVNPGLEAPLKLSANR